MLFAVKRYLWPSLLLLAVFVAVAFALRDLLGLTWTWSWRPIDLLLGMAVMAASDGLLHTAFGMTFRERYLSRFRALAEYFRVQRSPEVIAGGLLAGGEELVFRGVLLEGLRSVAGLSSAVALIVSSVIFGLLHAIPQRQLWPFTLWAVWEGALLGGVYIASGSLLVVIVLHISHDIVGFSVFAIQRRRFAATEGSAAALPPVAAKPE